jgi:hypothetical protein
LATLPTEFSKRIEKAQNLAKIHQLKVYFLASESIKKASSRLLK